MQSTILGLEEDQGPRHSATIPVLNIILYLLIAAISEWSNLPSRRWHNTILQYTYILTLISN